MGMDLNLRSILINPTSDLLVNGVTLGVQSSLCKGKGRGLPAAPLPRLLSRARGQSRGPEPGARARGRQGNTLWCLVKNSPQALLRAHGFACTGRGRL